MNTITAYNKPLAAFEDYKGHATDELTYKNNKAKLDALKPYFASHIYQVWDNFFTHRNKPFGHQHHIEEPRLVVFVKFGLMDEMLLNIKTYNDIENSKKELFLRQNRELFEAIVSETDDGWNYDFRPNGGWYTGGSPDWGENFPCGSKQNELNGKYYNLLSNELGDE